MVIDAHIRRVNARAGSHEQAARALRVDKAMLYRGRKRLDRGEPGAAGALGR